MTSKDEAESLMNDLLPFAKQMLRDYGEFWPFGGVLTKSGSITHVGAKTEIDGGPPGELVELLERAFRTEAAEGAIRSAAIVLNVTVTPPGGGDKVDAIEVRLDHVDGFTASVFFPYVIARGNVTTRPPFASRGVAFAFGGQ